MFIDQLILDGVLLEGNKIDEISDENFNRSTSIAKKMYLLIEDTLVENAKCSKNCIKIYVDVDTGTKKLLYIVVMRWELYDRLFGNLIPDQIEKETQRLADRIKHNLHTYDWDMFLEDIKKEERRK